MQPYARQLPAVQWIVSAQGGEVADRDRTTVLSRLFLAADALDPVRRRARLGVHVDVGQHARWHGAGPVRR